MARLRPFGERRADLRSAQEIYWLRETLSQLFEINLEHQPADYLLRFDEADLTEAELIAQEIRECL